MSDFRKLSGSMWASPQLELKDVAEAARQGFTLIINNRPDGEAAEQTSGQVIEAAARAAGMDYVAIPISHAGFSEPQVLAMEKAIQYAKGPVLAYCRSGTRSTLLWSLAQAHLGMDPEAIAAAATSAGYDIAPVRPAVDFYARNATN